MLSQGSCEVELKQMSSVSMSCTTRWVYVTDVSPYQGTNFLVVEDSTRMQAPAEASVDVLFAAFEMFLKHAWADIMGPVLSPKILGEMQAVLGRVAHSTT